MDREKITKVLEKMTHLSLKDRGLIADKILAEDKNKKVCCPYYGFQIFATCYCSKPEPGGNMSCMKCLKPLPYIFIPKAKEPPKNKIEPLNWEYVTEPKNDISNCIELLGKKVDEIISWINKQP